MKRPKLRFGDVDIDVELPEGIDERFRTFKENHQNPANIAMHGVGYLVIAFGAIRVLRGRFLSGLTLIGMGVALILGGHEIEGSDAFALLKRRAEGNGSAE